MSIQQLLKPANVDNRSSRLYAYSQTVKELNLDVPGGQLNLSPSGIGILGQQLTSDGVGGVYWSAGLPPIIAPDKIESADLSSSITAGAGGLLTLVGAQLDMNGASLRNPGLIDTSSATLNIITPTTQIAQGSSDWRVSVGAIDRLIMTPSTTRLFTQSAQSGPSGSSLVLNDDSTFVLGSYFSGNGALECIANNITLVGPQARSGASLTLTSISHLLFNGIATIPRDTIDFTQQTFFDNAGNEQLRVSSSGVRVSNVYSLPTVLGSVGQVITRTGLNTSAWQSPQIIGLYSATSTTTVANTIAQTSLIPAGVGSLTVPAGFFTPGMSFQLSCGGTFRDNANNTQITFRLTNSGTLFSTGLLALSNVPLATTAWNISTQFTYTGGTQIITNFTFSYNNGNDMFGFTSQQVNNTFNPLVSNTLDFTVQWAVASVNNTITCNYFTLTKLY
jgi:hypothetical protein